MSKRKSESEGVGRATPRKKAKGDRTTVDARGGGAMPVGEVRNAAQNGIRREQHSGSHPKTNIVAAERGVAKGAGPGNKKGKKGSDPTPDQKKIPVYSPNWQQLKSTLPPRKHKRSATGPGEEGTTVATKVEGFEDQPVKRPKALSKNTSIPLCGSLTKVVAIDCEMVGVGHDGVRSILAHICLLNSHGNVIYRKHVRPLEAVTDYRTFVSGIRAKDLRGPQAQDFWKVQKEVSEILRERILVGHAVHNDLKALLLSHPKRDTRDTAHYRPLKGASGHARSLKIIAKETLGLTIQEGEHSPTEDARAALLLYLYFRKEWEKDVQSRPRGDKRKGKRW